MREWGGKRRAVWEEGGGGGGGEMGREAGDHGQCECL